MEEPDTFLEQADCRLWQCGGYWVCGAIGSEDCDWCAGQCLIGKPVDDTPVEL